jgi:hypothetical protein
LKAKRRIKRPGKGPIGLRPAPCPLTILLKQLGDYLATAAALDRCMPQAPHLPLSIAS